MREYKIHIPIYTTEYFERSTLVPMTYPELIDLVIGKIHNFSFPIKSKHSNASKISVIDGVEIIKKRLGRVPALLLKVSSYETNFHDGYFEKDSQITLSVDSKLGTDNNYILIYPVIRGLDFNNYKCRYVLAIYEDPTKKANDVVKIAKTLIKELLSFKIHNIKLGTIMSHLRSREVIESLCMTFTQVEEPSNCVDTSCVQYLVKPKLKTKKKMDFLDIPVSNFNTLKAQTPKGGSYESVIYDIKDGDKTFRLIQDINQESGEIMNEASEMLFNYSVTISDDDLNERVFDENYIFSKLEEALLTFIRENNL